MFLFYPFQIYLFYLLNAHSFLLNSYLFKKTNAPNPFNLWNNLSLPKDKLNLHFDESKYNDFFEHDNSSNTNKDNLNKKFKKKKEDDLKIENKKNFDFSEKLNVIRPVNKGLKTRYTFQQFPKKQGVDKSNYKFCSNLRICGGSIRGRKLCVPPVYIRPIMSKVKMCVFNYLKFLNLFSVDKSLNVIDLFCGTGSLGLESLSYGADKCTFVDISLKCLKAVNLNVAKCGFEGKCRSIRSDSNELLNSPHLYNISEKFDLMFVCPPYTEVVYSDLLQNVSNCKILRDNAIVVVEYPKEISNFPNMFDKLYCIKNKKFGRTVIATFVYHSNIEHSNYLQLVHRNISSSSNNAPTDDYTKDNPTINNDSELVKKEDILIY